MDEPKFSPLRQYALQQEYLSEQCDDPALRKRHSVNSILAEAFANVLSDPAYSGLWKGLVSRRRLRLVRSE